MKVIEKDFTIRQGNRCDDYMGLFKESVKPWVGEDRQVVRFVVTHSDKTELNCEIGILQGVPASAAESVFDFRERQFENNDPFAVVFMVPTGIGAAIGGHAADATPAARLIANVCDTLITHPNVVNASDINELPPNGLYVEGSVLTRLMMGTIGLRKVRHNRILVAVDSCEGAFLNGAINSASSIRAILGAETSVAQIPSGFKARAYYAPSGRAVGEIEGLEDVCCLIEQHRDDFDALAICSYIDIPEKLFYDYFNSQGDVVNPWGGAEAMLTHAISWMYHLPSAHSPISLIKHIAGQADQEVTDCRMAAESVSLTYLYCSLKGLYRSPGIVRDENAHLLSGVITVHDISCLVIPDGCLGLPVFAALAQGIPVVAVRENANLMRNDLSLLPWRPGQFIRVDSYPEAAGVLVALREGICIESLHRPLPPTKVTYL